MKTTLLITQRMDKRSSASTSILTLIEKAFSNEIESGLVSLNANETLIILVESASVSLRYKVVNKAKTYILNIITDQESALSFHAMDIFVNGFSRCARKNNLNVIKAFDEPSQILCTRLYNPLTRFERLLRKLVYEIVVKTYGSAWYKNTIQDLKNHCEEISEVYKGIEKKSVQNHTKLIEAALEEMDYESLNKYLFSKNSPKAYSEVLEKELSNEKLLTMSKADIVDVIENSRPKSLWERLFNDLFELNDLENELSTIRKYRNKVMHARCISYEEYQTLHKLLKKWNILIEKAIEKNEVKDYNPFQSVSIIQTLSELKGLFAKLSLPTDDSIKESLNRVAKTITVGMKAAMSINDFDLSVFTKNLLCLNQLAISPSNTLNQIDKDDVEGNAVD